MACGQVNTVTTTTSLNGSSPALLNRAESDQLSSYDELCDRDQLVELPPEEEASSLSQPQQPSHLSSPLLRTAAIVSLEQHSIHSLEELESISELEARLGLRPSTLLGVTDAGADGEGSSMNDNDSADLPTPNDGLEGRLRFMTTGYTSRGYLWVVNLGNTKVVLLASSAAKWWCFYLLSDSFSEQFRDLFDHLDASSRLVHIAIDGKLRSSCFRSLCWKVSGNDFD